MTLYKGNCEQKWRIEQVKALTEVELINDFKPFMSEVSQFQTTLVQISSGMKRLIS